MKSHPLNGVSENRPPWIFFLLVFLLSIPIWAVGPIAERFLPEVLPENLPISALMFVAPVIAAVILVWREKGSDAAKKLLKRAFDYKRIRGKAWYVPILFFWPFVMVLQYGLMKLMRVPLPDPQIPVLIVPVSFMVFFIAALGEEVGWQGYAIDPLQDRWNALAASVLLGSVWAIWHVVPMIQMDQTPGWIASQCMSMVPARILTVWICNNTGKSVFAAILLHAMNNLTTVLLANYGWPYDPFMAFVITTVAAVLVVLLWGPKTLAQYRYSRRSRDVQAGAAG